MRLNSNDPNDPYEKEIQGDGVFTENPHEPELVEQRPLVRDMPELAVVPPRSELDDDVARLRETIKGASEVRPLPKIPERSEDKTVYNN